MAMEARQIKLETVSPDRGKLRNELIALYHQYISDVEHSVEIQREGEELIRGAKRERRAAQARMAKLRGLLDEEFPGWDSGLKANASGG
jgi:hypothetical protein